MRVYVDESGCTGCKFGQGSSTTFAVVAVLVRDDVAEQSCLAGIRAVRDKLEWHPNREFKFNRCDMNERLLFLRTMAHHPFQFWAFVLNKPHLMATALRKPIDMYTKVVQWVFENAKDELRGAEVVFDANGDRRFYEFLEGYLKRIMAGHQMPGAIAAVRGEDSRKNDMIQLADMVCGAVARYYSDKPDSRYYLTPIDKKHAHPIRYWPPSPKKT
jgi:hypothetical protein